MATRVLLLAAMVLSSILVHSQEPIPAARNYVRMAQEFLRSLYPDLAEKDYTMTLETSVRYDIPMKDTDQFYLYVGRGPKDMVIGYLGGYQGSGPPPTDFHPGPMYPEQLLIAGFQFSVEGKLTSFAAKGPSLGNLKKEQEAIDRLLAHPEITDAEAAAILKEAGAKYGPGDKEEFVRHLPIEGLQRFLGSFKLMNVEFPVLDANSIRSRLLEWHVTAKCENDTKNTKNEVSHEMWFEPFKGDLVRISAAPNGSAQTAVEN